MQEEAVKKCKIINSHLFTQVRGPDYVYILLESETEISLLLLIRSFNENFKVNLK